MGAASLLTLHVHRSTIGPIIGDMGVLRSMSALMERATSYPIESRHSADSTIEGRLNTTDPVKRHFLHTDFQLSPDNLLTPEEVAERLKVPESWVYEKTRARCRNPIPCMRLGRYIRFDWYAVINWLQTGAAQEQNATRTSLQTKR